MRFLLMGQPITFFNNNNKSWSELPENPLLRGGGGIPTPGARPKDPLQHGGGGDT